MYYMCQYSEVKLTAYVNIVIVIQSTISVQLPLSNLYYDQK